MDYSEVLFSGGSGELKNRPDITKELKIDDSAMIVEWGRKAIEQLVTLVRGNID